MSALATAWLPLLRYADFRGRSTRTEFALFYLLVSFLYVTLNWALSLGGVSAQTTERASQVLDLALLCPIVALATRHIHDSGRSAWWLLLGLPVLMAGLWRTLAHLLDPFNAVSLSLPVTIIGAAGLLPLLVLLLWDGAPGSNAYGPNPRHRLNGAGG